MPAAFSSSTFSPDNLIAGEEEPISEPITLISGQNLARGSVLGKITSGGKYTLSLAASSDGSQTPDVILAEACDASGGDKVTPAYFRGDFNQNAIILGAGQTVAAIKEGLRGKGIRLVNVQTTY